LPDKGDLPSGAIILDLDYTVLMPRRVKSPILGSDVNAK
jgi:hypothetical protein